jgi:hypothetical protein
MFELHLETPAGVVQMGFWDHSYEAEEFYEGIKDETLVPRMIVDTPDGRTVQSIVPLKILSHKVVSSVPNPDNT